MEEAESQTQLSQPQHILRTVIKSLNFLNIKTIEGFFTGRRALTWQLNRVMAKMPQLNHSRNAPINVPLHVDCCIDSWLAVFLPVGGRISNAVVGSVGGRCY